MPYSKDFVYVIRRRSIHRIAAPAEAIILAYINYFLNNGGLIRTLLADAFGLIILWAIVVFVSNSFFLYEIEF